MAQAVRKTSEVFNDERSAQVAALSQRVFNKTPKRVAFPGGTSRAAFIADMGDSVFVFAKRENKDDAQLEGIVLKTLGDTGYVPRLRAVVDDWVVQEFLQGNRLPLLINETDSSKKREALVSSALESLIHIHEAAHRANLQHRMPKIGTVDKWLWNRTGAAKRISKSIGIMPPELNREKLVSLMDVKRDEFVKWDARPGNAMVNDGRVVWFDWEDCGRSKALDDLGFMLCDEWTELTAEAEARIKAKFLPFFNRSMTSQKAEDYLTHFGMTHMILRLRLAQKLHTRDGKWWDRDYCLKGDKIGVTSVEMGRLVNRMLRWSDGVAEWQPLRPWLHDVAGHYGLVLD